MNTERFYIFITSKETIIKFGILLVSSAIGLYLCIIDIDFKFMPMILGMVGFIIGWIFADICTGFIRC